jgi:hypothetical protein
MVNVAEGKQSLHDVERISKTKAGTLALSAADAEREQWRAKVVASKKLARAGKQSLRDVGKMAKTEVSHASSGDKMATVAVPKEQLPSRKVGTVTTEVPRISEAERSADVKHLATMVKGSGGDSLTGDVELEILTKTQKRQKRKKAQRLREKEELPSVEAGSVTTEVPMSEAGLSADVKCLAVAVSGAGDDSLIGDVEVEKLSKTQKRQKRKKAQRLREKEELPFREAGTMTTEVPRISEAEPSMDVKYLAVAVKGAGGNSLTGDVDVQKLSKTQKRRKARMAQKLRESLEGPVLNTANNVEPARQQVKSGEAGSESIVEPLNVQTAKVAAKTARPIGKRAVEIDPEAPSPKPARRTIELPHMVSGEEVLEYAVKHQKDPLRLAAALTRAGKVAFSGPVGLVRAWAACCKLKKPPQASLRAALSKATVMVDSA